MSENRFDHKELVKALRRSKCPQETKYIIHVALCATKKGIEIGNTWQYLDSRRYATEGGFFLWEYFPQDKKRNWIEQPD